jgi:hypothetical protein
VGDEAGWRKIDVGPGNNGAAVRALRTNLPFEATFGGAAANAYSAASWVAFSAAS